MLVAAVSVDLGAEDGHDLHQITAELLHGWQILGLIQDGDLDPEMLADLEDNLASKPSQRWSSATSC